MTQEEKDNKINELIQNAEYGVQRPSSVGGQQINPCYLTGVWMKVEEVEFYISISFEKSQLKNKQHCVDSFRDYMNRLLQDT